jgi:molybdate transport system substrate-binding protein
MRILSSLAFRSVLDELAPLYEAQHASRLIVSYDPTALILGRIQTGERADIALLTADGIEGLLTSGVLRAGSRIDLADSEVGIAVKAGTVKPDISSEAAVRRTLLAARSIAYSKAGASGIFFAKVIEKLGIGEAIRNKTTIIPSGFTAELAADGRAEIAVQQISELMVVPGIEIVGPLPPDMQERLTFSGGVFAEAADSAAAAEVLQFMARREFAVLYHRKGLLPKNAA